MDVLVGANENFEVYSLATGLLNKYFKSNENDDINYFFEQDLKRNGNNIYDDTLHKEGASSSS